MRKIKIKALNGCVSVESYGGKDRAKCEWDRAKIYDENMEYIDYICLDGKTYTDYKEIVDCIKNSSNIEFFIEFTTGQTNYDYSESLTHLLESIFDNGDCDNDVWQELQNDIATLREKELLDKYMINKVGDYYFYLGEY